MRNRDFEDSSSRRARRPDHSGASPYEAPPRDHHRHGPHRGGRGEEGRERDGVRGRRGRGRRGDVRYAILALLQERPMHGYEMMQELAERTQGLWRPSPGSLYPALQLLEDQGYVRSESADGRRQFTLTEEGRAH